jgi:hypothetical protein
MCERELFIVNYFPGRERQRPQKCGDNDTNHRRVASVDITNLLLKLDIPKKPMSKLSKEKMYALYKEPDHFQPPGYSNEHDYLIKERPLKCDYRPTSYFCNCPRLTKAQEHINS